ncbi:MAG: DUF502 domain-containing protein [Planctomycetota bacterium]|nr:DUF502 domain-containing protein [Planctomycetota bacterium]
MSRKAGERESVAAGGGTSTFRRFFVRGLAVLLPSILTLWILWYAGVFVYKNVAEPINRGIRLGVISLMPSVPTHYQPEWYLTPNELITLPNGVRPAMPDATTPTGRVALHNMRKQAFATWWGDRWYYEALGLVVAIVLFYSAGVLVGGLLGRQIYSRVERLLGMIPGVKQVYPHVKQVVDMVLGDKQHAFRRVVLVRYPSERTWIVAFVTGNAPDMLCAGAGEPCLTVFIPTTPTPFTGFTLTVPARDVVDVPMSVDEALRYLITAGVLLPDAAKARRVGDVPSGSPLPETGGPDTGVPGEGARRPVLTSSS